MSAEKKMDAKYINPFIESVYDLFNSMINCPVERCDISVKEHLEFSYEIVALIGLSGPARGTVALLLPTETALCVVSRFMQEEIKEVDESVIDAVAELVNIVAGGAKARLCDDEPVIKLGLPNVIKGKGYTVYQPTKTIWLEIPFKSECGTFSMRLTFDLEMNGRDAS